MEMVMGLVVMIAVIMIAIVMIALVMIAMIMIGIIARIWMVAVMMIAVMIDMKFGMVMASAKDEGHHEIRQKAKNGNFEQLHAHYGLRSQEALVSLPEDSC
jgi:signal transduction histidine kinase